MSARTYTVTIEDDRGVFLESPPIEYFLLAVRKAALWQQIYPGKRAHVSCPIDAGEGREGSGLNEDEWEQVQSALKYARAMSKTRSGVAMERAA